MTCFSDHFLSLAGLMLHVVNNGDATQKGFAKDPVVFFFNEVVRRLTRIRNAFVAPIPISHSDIPGVDANPLFSRDHFQFLLCHVFYKARTAYEAPGEFGDFPIIWRLKHSDRNVHLGHALLFILRSSYTYQVLPEDQVANNRVLLLFRPPTLKWVYNDNFFFSLQACYQHCPFANVLLGRLYLSLVCEALNNGNAADKVTMGALEKAASRYTIGEDFLLSYFWTTDERMHSYITASNKKTKFLGCNGIDKASLADKFRSNWDAILVGVDQNILRRRLAEVKGTGNPRPDVSESLDYSFVTDEQHPHAYQFNDYLSIYNLGDALKAQANDFVVTSLFLTTLSTYRRGYMEIRNRLQTACVTPGVDHQPIYAEAIAHAKLNGVSMTQLTTNVH
jgi:hypothetical protein